MKVESMIFNSQRKVVLNIPNMFRNVDKNCCKKESLVNAIV